MAKPTSFSFVGGPAGDWRIDRILTVSGPPLADAPRLAVVEGDAAAASGAWVLRGWTEAPAYTSAPEAADLAALSPPLGRAAATHGALIPIRKSPAWWALSACERHAIFLRSRHTPVGLEYLPRVARRLHHCRRSAAPFDFLTWFEFAPEHAVGFDDLVARLRASEEWRYVEREVDVRVRRAGP